MSKRLVLLRAQRARRVRKAIRGTSERPRLSVFRSARRIYAQLIDDEQGVTLIAASDAQLEGGARAGTKQEIARRVGALLALRAKQKKIRRAVFDRGPYPFHGRIAALAAGAREGGLEF